MTLIIRTGALRHVLGWGQTGAGPGRSPQAVAERGTVPQGLTCAVDSDL